MTRISRAVSIATSFSPSRGIAVHPNMDAAASSGSTDFDKQTGSSTSDGYHIDTIGPYESGSTYSFNNNATTMKVGYQAPDEIGAADGYSWSIFARIAGVTIPQGSTIDSATIKFYTPASSSATGKSVTIDGNDVNSAAIPTNEGHIRSATKTSATVSWTFGSISGGSIESPEIKTIVQEIVNRAGWASGNAMTIYLHTPTTSSDWDLTVRTYDHSSGQAPHINITYS